MGCVIVSKRLVCERCDPDSHDRIWWLGPPHPAGDGQAVVVGPWHRTMGSQERRNTEMANVDSMNEFEIDLKTLRPGFVGCIFRQSRGRTKEKNKKSVE